MVSFKLDNPKAYIREWLPKCCTKLKTCSPDRRTNAFALARENLEIETNIIELIK